MDSYNLKYSGTDEIFSTGAKREQKTGKGFYDCLSPTAIRRVAIVYEKGAVNHGKHNCRKGIPLSSYINSAMRHIFQRLEGLTNEDHAAQAIWNLSELIHTEEMVERGLLPEELDDLPNYTTNDTASLPKTITAYLTHPIRGSAGEASTAEVRKANNNKAKEFAQSFRQLFPHIDLYVPAEQDECLARLMENKVLTIEDVLTVDCEILQSRDILISYTPDGYCSEGMKIEIAAAKRKKIPRYSIVSIELLKKHTKLFEDFLKANTTLC